MFRFLGKITELLVSKIGTEVVRELTIHILAIEAEGLILMNVTYMLQ